MGGFRTCAVHEASPAPWQLKLDANTEKQSVRIAEHSAEASKPNDFLLLHCRSKDNNKETFRILRSTLF